MYGGGKKLNKSEEEVYYRSKREWDLVNNRCIEYESNAERNENVSLKEYLDKIKPYLRDLITDLLESDTWKNPLALIINFISSKDAAKERVMHAKTDNIRSYNVQIIMMQIKLLMNSLIHLFQDVKVI